MRSGKKPFSAVRLHSLDERCWGVVDADGALVDFDGLSMKLTRQEADALVSEKNESEDPVVVKAS